MYKCEVCGRTKDLLPFQHHHKFSATDKNIELYPEYIHLDNNRQIACSQCHSSHRSPKLKHLTEIEFCVMNNIEPRSKVGKEIWARMKNDED